MHARQLSEAVAMKLFRGEPRRLYFALERL